MKKLFPNPVLQLPSYPFQKQLSFVFFLNPSGDILYIFKKYTYLAHIFTQMVIS